MLDYEKRPLAIVVPEIYMVKVLLYLSKKSQKSQNLMITKDLTWPKLDKNRKMPQFRQKSISFYPKTVKE